MERQIRSSAKALVIKDGKMLAIKISDGREEWFIMPGGGQTAGETLDKAVEREVLEETGMKVSAKDVAFVIEGSHGEKFHRIDIVFDCEYIGQDESAEKIMDTMQSGLEWIDIEGLNRRPLYPSRLRRAIMNHYEGKKTNIYLGNECMGDPEITD